MEESYLRDARRPFQLRRRINGSFVSSMECDIYEEIQITGEGTASPCFVSNLLNDIDTDAVSQREIIKGCAGLAYAGGCPHAV